jgi:hypothetical protein
MIMNGFDYATMIYIILRFSSEIAAKIQDKLERGVTYLNGRELTKALQRRSFFAPSSATSQPLFMTLYTKLIPTHF